MNSDRYTKFVLTYIAICLSLLTLKELGVVPQAHAQQIIPVSIEGRNAVVICDGATPRCADVRPNGNGTDGLVITVPR